MDTNWHFIDNISWRSGKHDIKFGYEFRRTSISQIFNRTFRGRLKFLSLDSFLAGIPDNGGTQGIGSTDRNTFENSQAFYLQDSYRLTRRLTVNLGLRYDYFGMVQEKHDMFTNVDPTTGIVSPVGSGRLYQPDYNNWAPRLSVAWDVNGKGKTVVRAGYGIFYDAFSQDMFMGHLPFSSSFDPGPAYSGLPGVGQISFGSPTGVPFALNVHRVWKLHSNGRCLWRRSAYAQSIFGELQPQLAATVDPQNCPSSGVCRLCRGTNSLTSWTSTSPQRRRFGRRIVQVSPVPHPASLVPPDRSAPRCRVGSITISLTSIGKQSAANSNYNALQTTLRIDNWHGLTTGLSYTWSHSIDTASDGEDYVPNAAQPTDSTNPASNRGNSNFDIRNRLSWNFMYEFPNRKGSLEKLTNGWGLNGILTVQSGNPFHLILGARRL